MSATPTTPAAAAVTPATPAASEAPKAAPELDVVALLLPGSVKAADKPKDEATGATDGAAADGTNAAAAGAGAAGEADGAAVETPAAAVETPKPGTSDKALQKLQQDQAAAQRKIEELSAKIEAGIKPTAADAAQLQAAKRKLDGIREGLKAKGAEFDLLDHDTAVAESLVEHDDKLTAAEQQLAEANRRIAALESRGNADAEAQNWARNEAAYPKVDVRAVWAKAQQDAAGLIGVDPATLPADSPLHDAVFNAATNLFHGRAAATAKQLKGKETPAAAAAAATPPKPPTTRTAADPTPNGGRVTGNGSNPATGDVSEDTAYVNLAVGLVKT